MSCDHRHPRGGPVFVVGFNRPKAISCLATALTNMAPDTVVYVSIARRRLVVLRRHATDTFEIRTAFVSIARRRLVVLRRKLTPVPGIKIDQCFNRPKAISCLATGLGVGRSRRPVRVSIARRRLVVLRRRVPPSCTPLNPLVSIARRRLVVLRRQRTPCVQRLPKEVSIARRRLVVLRHQFAWRQRNATQKFQSPEGD